VILVDSSAWVEFLRTTDSPAHLRVRSALQEGDELASTDMIVMEILAGARDEADHDRLRRLLYGLEFLTVDGPGDYESAAELYRLCRSGGETPRKLSDCLIAAVAIRNDAELLCGDADFLAIARHCAAATCGRVAG
jgi:predicted nucleic acid-binding protein